MACGEFLLANHVSWIDIPALAAAGLRYYRIELLEENAAETTRILAAYRALAEGKSEGADLARALHAQAQLGVTRGTLEEKPTASATAALS